MKIIFLDVDGVLNNINDFKQKKNKEELEHGLVLSKPKIKLLHQIQEKTGAKIVLSSTWI